MLKNTLKRILDASKNILAKKLYKSDSQGFMEDLQHQKLRRIILEALDQISDDAELQVLATRVFLRWGLIRASPEDLLLAASL